MEQVSTIKTKVETEAVARAITSHFHSPVRNIEAIQSGESSQAFSFSIDGHEYVARINKEREGFTMDQYAHDHFSTAHLPIPKTLYIAPFDSTHFIAITERSRGRLVEELSKDEVYAALPSLIATLDAIHNTPIETGTTYGDRRHPGKMACSWKEYLNNRAKALRQYNAIPNKAIFYDHDYVQSLITTFESLIQYCPNERKLVHGDFGFSNTLIHGTTVTGVIDWEQSKYGDPLFDVAWLALWDDHIPYVDIFFNHYTQQGTNVTNFKQCVLCYILHSGIGALKFFAESNQQRKYEYATKRLSLLLTQLM
jgi:hygromycin-B 4-O-kinase